MEAGAFVAHSVTSIVALMRGESGHETVERPSTGAAGHLTMLLGFALALALVTLGRWACALSYPFHPSLELRLLVGLALQVPFGVLASVVAKLLLESSNVWSRPSGDGRLARGARPNRSRYRPLPSYLGYQLLPSPTHSLGVPAALRLTTPTCTVL